MTHPQDPNDPFSGIEPYRGLGSESPMSHEDHDRLPTPPPRSPLLTGMILGLLLVVVSIALFQLLSGDDDPQAGGATGTTVPADAGRTTDASGEGTVTTSADGATDTTGGTPATPGGGTPYTAEGEPIPVTELLLAADAVGPIELGQPAAQAVGRLLASLGDPDEDTGPRPSTGEWGVCEGETERIVRWGPFAAIVVVDPDGTETFGAYRLDLSYGGLSSETVDLATLSGLQAGTSLRRLEQIYDGFVVNSLEDPVLGPVWTLESSETGNLLLWGPLTADDSVRGIYSPDACGRF